jgi:Lar family restriction alleviation protein
MGTKELREQFTKERGQGVISACGYTRYFKDEYIEWLEEKLNNLGETRNAVLADVGERFLPCPFCGIPPAIGSLADDKKTWCIWCVACGIAFYGESREDIIRKWNQRANVS